MNAGKNAKALAATAAAGGFVLGTLWLCLNVTWWFASAWFLLPFYLACRVFLSAVEQGGGAADKKDNIRNNR